MKYKFKIIHLFLINSLLLLVTIAAEARNIATMFENNRPFFTVGEGGFGSGLFGTPLFCEGDSINPCGFVEYNINTSASPILTRELVRLPMDTRVCRGDNCQCDDINPCVCENLSCVSTPNALFHLLPMQELQGLLEDGDPFAATMTQHPPIECANTTGEFLTECSANGLKVDYRCEVVVVFDENGQFVRLSRSLAGGYVISNNQP